MFLQKQRLAIEGEDHQQLQRDENSKALAIRDSGGIVARDSQISSGSKYDHLKRAAEKLMIQQATASTDLELLRSSLTKGEAVRIQQEEYIKELTEDKARLSSLLKSEKEVLAKLTFDVTATQALCASLKESFQYFQEKINQAAADRSRIQGLIEEQKRVICQLQATLERKGQENTELNKILEETRDEYQRFVLETSEKLAKLEEEKQAAQELSSTQATQLHKFEEKYFQSDSACTNVKRRILEQEAKITLLEKDYQEITENLKSLQTESEEFKLASEAASTEQQRALTIANDALIEALLKLETADEDNRVLHLKLLQLETAVTESEDLHKLSMEEFQQKEHELQGFINTLKSDKKTLEETVGELGQKYETVVEECAMTKAAIAAEKLQNEDLTAQVAMKSKEILSVTSQLETLAKEFEESRASHMQELNQLEEKHATECEILKNDYFKSKEESLKENEEKLNSQIAQLREEHDNAIKVLNAANEKEVQILQEALLEKESHLSSLLAEKDEELSKAHRKIQDLVHSLSSELLSIKQKHDSELASFQSNSEEEARALKKQLNEATEENRVIQDQVNELNARIKELTVENEALREKEAKESKKAKMNLLDMPTKFSFTKKEARDLEKAKLQDESTRKAPEKVEQKGLKAQKEHKGGKDLKAQKDQQEAKIKELAKQNEKCITSLPQTPVDTKKKRSRKSGDSDSDAEWKEVAKKKSTKSIIAPTPKTKTRKIQETTTIKKISKVEPKQSKSDAIGVSSIDSSKRIRKTVCRSQMDLFEDVFTFNE